MIENGKPGITLKWVHVLLWLALQLVGFGIVYGTIKFTVEDHERRLQKLEEATQGFREIKEEISRRLDKLETKLDLVITNLPKR